MTVSATTRKAGPYAGNGVGTVFTFSFKVFAKADVAVVLTDSNGVATPLVLDSDYSVLLNADQDSNPGGSITYPALVGPAPLPIGSTLTMIGGLPYDQNTDITNAGRFLPQVLENAYDKLTILTQQLKEISDRTLQAAVGTTVKLLFPAPSSGKMIRWRSDLLGLENVEVGSDSTALQGFLADAALDTHGAGMVGFSSALSYPASTVGAVLKTVADLPSLTDAAKGAALVGYKINATGGAGRTLANKLLEFVSVKDFGAVGDGTTDDTAAFQAAFNASASIYVPSGTYRLTATLTVTNKSFNLVGAGKGATTLLWTAAVASGVSFICNTGLSATNRFPCTVRDLTFAAGVPACGVALLLTYTIAASGFVYTGVNSAVLDNLDMRGSDYFATGLNYWTTGLRMVNCGSVQAKRLNIIAKQNTAGSRGIHIEATNGANTSFFFNDIAATWCETGVDIYNNTASAYTIEGLYFSDFELVGCDRGFLVRGGPVHAMRLANGHSNADTAALQYDITARGSTTLGVSNCYFQLGNLFSGAFKAGSVIAIDVVHYSQFVGNYISGKPSPFTVTQNGIAVLSSNRCSISGNTFLDLNGTGIVIGNNGTSGDCVDTRAGDTNTFQNVLTPTVVSGSTNGAARSSKQNPGYTTNAHGVTHQFGSAVATLNGSGDANIALPIAFPNALLGAVICNGDPGTAGSAAFLCNFSASTTSALNISVRPNPGAVSVRVNFMADGF